MNPLAANTAALNASRAFFGPGGSEKMGVDPAGIGMYQTLITAAYAKRLFRTGCTE
jgi:hypothetical protein